VSPLLSIALSLAQAGAGAGAGRALARTARCTAGLIAAGIAGLAASACLLAAIWLFAAPEIGAPAATLLISALLATLSGIALVVALRPAAAPPPPPRPVVPDIEALLRAHKLPVLLAAVLAGAMASQPGR
jgi:hypothetical protein